jgi:hypothetical protein
VARIVGVFVQVGTGIDAELSEWRPIWFAFGIELLAAIGPVGMFAAVGEREGGAAPGTARRERGPLSEPA